MQIRVFLTSGSIHCYEEEDEASVRHNVSRLAPDTVFAEAIMTFGSEDVRAAYPAQTIRRVEVDLAAWPEWPFPPNVTDSILTTREQFDEAREQARASAVSGGGTPEDSLRDGDAFVAHAEIEDTTGEQLWLEVRGTLLAGVARKGALSRVLEAPCLYARRGESTAVLINTDQIVSLRVFPGSIEMPASALRARAAPPS